VYDGPLPVEKISHDDYDEPGPKRRRSSESNTERPIVGVRFSLGSIKVSFEQTLILIVSTFFAL